MGTRSSLSCVLSESEWAQLRLEFKKQALLGIGYVGVTKLPAGQTPPIQVLAQWVHNAEKIRKKNERLNAECVRLCEQLEHDGLWCCVLKGQSNLVNYRPSWPPLKGGNEPDGKSPFKGDLEGLALYRTPGDIDVWCAPFDRIEIAEGGKDRAEYVSYRGERAVIEYALMQARLKTLSNSPLKGESSDDKKSSPFKGERGGLEVRYHHVELADPSTGSGQAPVDVEIHHRPSFMCSPWRNRRLRDWCRKYEGVNDNASILGHTIPVPTPSFNAIYQLVHIYRHLFDEGIGLRQLLDYYFVLRSLHIEQGSMGDHTQSMGMWAESIGRGVSSNTEIMHTLGRFGMKKFAGAVMYVLQTAFNMPDVYLLCKPNEKEGKFLLNEIMLAGNFGKYDDRINHEGGQLSHAWEKTKHNLRMLTHYPEEVMWEPWFRLYHWMWRKLELWRF